MVVAVKRIGSSGRTQTCKPSINRRSARLTVFSILGLIRARRSNPALMSPDSRDSLPGDRQVNQSDLGKEGDRDNAPGRLHKILGLLHEPPVRSDE